ncbi:hypothetical protein LCZ91_22600 [Xanthomonas citri pv. mangiferaeindicae]|uniref:hypothetical protein n=1 Tax=Xanthomonas citri TaxID=346 RepID=UPI001CFC9B93|nr:hypothetical protein [Xanthomonas citri]UDB90693.1 hypothetical protein LCZ91_22600 [Xanthomonas citri pv. mangiferaeindicae]
MSPIVIDCAASVRRTRRPALALSALLAACFAAGVLAAPPSRAGRATIAGLAKQPAKKPAKKPAGAAAVATAATIPARDRAWLKLRGA